VPRRWQRSHSGLHEAISFCRLAISLPSQELAGFVPSGSVFSPRELSRASLSPLLQGALGIVRRHCAVNNVPILMIARPELFQHGESLRWLFDRLAKVRDHLIFSDGKTVRPLPAMRNHLWLYQIGLETSANDFERFRSAAPELVANMDSQVNTALPSQPVGATLRPPPTLLQARAATKPYARHFFRYIPRGSIERTVSRTLSTRTDCRLTTEECLSRGYSSGQRRRLWPIARLSKPCTPWSRPIRPTRAIPSFDYRKPQT